MNSALSDFQAECEELDTFLDRIPETDWARQTVFFDWTIADQIMHLHQVDNFTIAALSQPDKFPDVVTDVRAGQAAGIELSQRMRQDFEDLSIPELQREWREGWQRAIALLEKQESDARMPWFGPPMAVGSVATARQMETWAHGQDIYDLMRVRRPMADRVQLICGLGIRTFGWTFRNRGMDKPDPVEVRLTLPSGATMSWNEGADQSVSGLAEDFALIVTQRRHIDDTSLETNGDIARAWMEIAQCFAGKPANGPAAGERVVNWA